MYVHVHFFRQTTRTHKCHSGGGLGGLVLALLLQKNDQDSDIQVDIYEGASDLAEIGAGLAMWPRIIEIMRYLGVEEDLLKLAGDGHSGGMSMSTSPLVPPLTTPAAIPVYYRKADQKESVQFLEMDDTCEFLVTQDVTRTALRKLLQYISSTARSCRKCLPNICAPKTPYTSRSD